MAGVTGPLGEFDLLAENAAELGLPFSPPQLSRRTIHVAPGQTLSAIRWGAAPPGVVFLHGGGQNAHTWDSVLLALDVPALAVDLPGHGRSYWRTDHDYSAQSNADAVAVAIREQAVTPVSLIGMSLGGLTAISVTHRFPELVKKLLVVDVSPQSLTRFAELTQAQRGSVALTSGPATFDSFEDLLEATVQAAPGRSRSSLRRGALHNAKELPDGRWAWRYDRQRHSVGAGVDPKVGWDEFAAIKVPIMLVRGADSGFVHDDDVAQLRRLQPDLAVRVVERSGHSVQSDQPLVLANLVREFIGLIDAE